MAAKPRKTEIRVAVDEDFLQELQDRLGLEKSTDVTRAALTLLDWASEEAQDGRVILSTDREGKAAHRLVMRELNNVRPGRKAS